MEDKVWTDVEVTWNSQYHYWEIYGDNISLGEFEWLGLANLKTHAVEDAIIYAFDTGCGPARGEKVRIFSKAGKLLKTVEAA